MRIALFSALISYRGAGFKISLEKCNATAAAAICIPASPVNNTRAAQGYLLAAWWEKWKHSIASHYRRLNTTSSVFLVSGIRTTAQYANCCHVDSATSTELYISGSPQIPTGATFSFSTGAKVEEVTRSFGFQIGDYDPRSLPWVIFVTKLPASFWGPIRTFKTALVNKLK